MRRGKRLAVLHEKSAVDYTLIANKNNQSDKSEALCPAVILLCLGFEYAHRLWYNQDA